MSFVETAAARLALPVLSVRFEHRERAVFDSRTADGQRVVVKVDTVPGRASRERLALQSARAGGVPVPDVVRAELRSPSALVLTHVEGHPLGPSSPEAAWVGAAAVLRRLHELAPPPGLPAFPDRPWLEWAAHECDQAVADGLLEQSVARRLNERMKESFSSTNELAPRFVHGDCQPDHVLLSAGARVAGLLDFGDAGLGDPVWDLVVLTLEHQHRVGAVLDGYEAGEELRHRVDALSPGYRILRHVGSASWLQEHGYDPEPDLEAVRGLA